jgi:peptidoglycan hydrolase CwlO-like protein
MGEPSPALTQINKMNIEQLTQRIEALEVESGHIGAKIKNLSHQQPPNDVRIAALTTQKARLAALIQVAQDRLSGKAERREQYDSGGGRPFRR